MNRNKQWLQSILHLLDNPECLVPEMNSFVKDTSLEEWKQAVKFCLVAPVPYSAMVANLGFAIIYDMLNAKLDGIVCERFYFPEGKLLRRIEKAGKLFFSKETCMNLRDFDAIGFSSYFPLQMFAVPEILEKSGMAVFTKERDDSTPLVIFGGITSFNSAPIFNMVDVVVIGEGEEVLPKILEVISEHKGEKDWKETVKQEICSFTGVYIPEYYSETFYPADHSEHPNQLKEHKPKFEWVPPIVTKATIDMKKHPPLTKMLVSNSEGSEMSCGSLMLATGCSNRCLFCNGSFISAPYRERTLEQVKEGFTQLIYNTGAHAVTPYSFNLSDFSCVNSLTKWLLEDENKKVSMSSQRIDYFNDDFAKVARLSGNRSITLAIEAGGQRMRNVVNKNLTEEEILRSFRTAFEVGFSSIKVYMIANLPFETDEDRFAIVPLIEKIAKLREEVGAKTRVRISYTPFQAKNHTPFQWAPTLEVYTKKHIGSIKTEKMVGEEGNKKKITTFVLEHDIGMPIFEKNLGPVIEGVHKHEVKFRVGTNSDLSVINQCLTLGDRRMAAVVWELYKSKGLRYRGGMSVGKNPLEDFRKMLKKQGLDYEYFLREKDEDEVFPWDFIDAGITKEFLLKAWQLAKFQNQKDMDGNIVTKGSPPAIRKILSNPFDEAFKGDLVAREKRKNGGLPPCFIKCTGCGCCGKDSKVAHINMPDHSKDIKNIADTLTFQKKKIKYTMLLKIFLYDEFRWVHGSKVKMHLRRAAIRAGLPILNEFSLASDEIIFQNWIGGVDYAECLVFDRPELTMEEIVKALNKELWNMEVISVDFITSTKKILRKAYDSVFYRIPVPLHKSLEWQTRTKIKNYVEADSFIIKMKVKGSQRDTLEIVEHDLKQDKLAAIWVDTEESVDYLSFYLLSFISPYDIMPFLFGLSKRTGLKYPARRIDYFMASKVGEQDMFSQICEECSHEIEHNLSDIPISDTHCVRHLANVTKSEYLQNLFQVRECKQHFLPPTK